MQIKKKQNQREGHVVTGSTLNLRALSRVRFPKNTFLITVIKLLFNINDLINNVDQKPWYRQNRNRHCAIYCSLFWKPGSGSVKCDCWINSGILLEFLVVLCFLAFRQRPVQCGEWKEGERTIKWPNFFELGKIPLRTEPDILTGYRKITNLKLALF